MAYLKGKSKMWLKIMRYHRHIVKWSSLTMNFCWSNEKQNRKARKIKVVPSVYLISLLIYNQMRLKDKIRLFSLIVFFSRKSGRANSVGHLERPHGFAITRHYRAFMQSLRIVRTSFSESILTPKSQRLLWSEIKGFCSWKVKMRNVYFHLVCKERRR